MNTNNDDLMRLLYIFGSSEQNKRIKTSHVGHGSQYADTWYVHIWPTKIAVADKTHQMPVFARSTTHLVFLHYFFTSDWSINPG